MKDLKPEGKNSLGCTTIFFGLLLIAAIVFLAPRLFGNGDEAEAVNENDDIAAQSDSEAINLGELVIAEQVDRDGCAVDEVSSLRNPEQFYVVAPDSEVPEGTDIFVRLYQDGVAVEDLPIITANQDYNSTCINFVFETTDGDDFEAGDYEAEFWVNGNSYDSVSFEIQ